VVGTDPRTDLAVVKIKADNVIAANWGDSSQLEKGDWVIAFGSPLGYVGSMTHGIVSALNRTVGILGQAGIEEFIQTDAPINPGNSGGPLVNTRGEVVGINSCIASQTGGSQGIGFAVPEKLAKPVFEHLKADGKVTRGWLGVAIADVSTKSDDLKDVVASTGFKGEKGILVSETVRSSPAYGVLEPSDVITAVNGKGVTNLHDFRETIASFSPGTEVKFSVFRAGKTIDVSVKLGNQPEQMEVASAEQGQRMLRAPRGETSHGMTLRNLTENGAKQFGFDAGDEGALVVNVQPNSAAARAGLKAGDLITSVNGTPVKGSAEAAKALKENDGKSLRLSVTNAEGSRVVVIREK
jgi:serine protease Do